jgi:hypothetical protein
MRPSKRGCAALEQALSKTGKEGDVTGFYSYCDPLEEEQARSLAPQAGDALGVILHDHFYDGCGFTQGYLGMATLLPSHEPGVHR